MVWFSTSGIGSSDAAVRRKAIEELANETPSARTFGLLVRALGHPDPEVRRIAALGLGRSDDDHRINYLLSTLNDPEPVVIKSAMVALRRAPSDRITPTLKLFLRHKDAGVRAQAAKVLEVCGWEPSSKEEEIWFLVGKKDFSAAAALGSIAIPALQAAAECNIASISSGAMEALAAMKYSGTLSLLAKALKSPDTSTCVAALNALQRSDDPQALQYIVSVIRHENPRVRLAVIEALGRLRVKESAFSLVELLRDKHWEVRRDAAETLGRIGNKSVAVDLSRGLSDPDPDVREATAMALGFIGTTEVIPALVMSLKDNFSTVRRLVAAALSRIDQNWPLAPGAREALDQLKSSLPDGDANVRYFVSNLLVGLGSISPGSASAQRSLHAATPPAQRRKLAAAILEKLLFDRDHDIRLGAAEALGKMGDHGSLPALSRAAADADQQVADAAAASFKSIDPSATLSPTTASDQQ